MSSPAESTPEGPISDPGVTVASGDPEKIDNAGSFHHAVAEKLEAHSALIKSTASFLLNGWNGQASKEYHAFTHEVSGHYEITAAQAREVGRALKKFASELGKSQGEGRTALKNAIHWMNEFNHWHNKVSEISDKVTDAEKDVKTAMQNVVSAQNALNAATDPREIHTLTANLNTAKSNLSAARGKVADLQNQQAAASKKMLTASEQFTGWQKKGGEALENAELAAGVAGYALGIVAVNSPPAARILNPVLDGVSSSDEASISWGIQDQSRTYGSKLANGSYYYSAGANAQGSIDASANANGVSADLKGSVTAGLQGGGQVSAGWSQFGGNANVDGLVGATASGESDDSVGTDGVKVDNNVQAFAGAQVTGSATEHIGFFSLNENGQLSAGAGAGAGETFEFTKNNVEIGWNIGASLGVGAGGGVSLSFDPEEALHDGEKAYDFVTSNAGTALHDTENAGKTALHDTENAGKTALHYANPLNW